METADSRGFFIFMAKTKEEKKKIIEVAAAELKRSQALIFADFGGVKTEELVKLRRTLREADSTFEVIKKQLLKIIFRETKVDYDPLRFESQVGTVFTRGELTPAAGVLYRFSKENALFKILGGFDLKANKAVTGETVKAIGQLPSREALLGQLVQIMASPIRMFLYVLSERSKKEASPSA